MAGLIVARPERKPAPVAGAAPAVGAEAVAVAVRAVGVWARYRAGLGPFGPEPTIVAATRDQLAALRADPLLVVEVSAPAE